MSWSKAEATGFADEVSFCTSEVEFDFDKDEDVVMAGIYVKYSKVEVEV